MVEELRGALLDSELLVSLLLWQNRGSEDPVVRILIPGYPTATVSMSKMTCQSETPKRKKNKNVSRVE